MLPWDEFQGILIAPSTLQYTQNERKALQEEIFSDFKEPVISLDYESDYFDTIMLDDAVAMQKMTEHLVNEHCYTDIAFLSGPLWHAHAQRRLEGYKRGLEACNIPYDETKVFEGNFWYGGGTASLPKINFSRPQQLLQIVNRVEHSLHLHSRI